MALDNKNNISVGKSHYQDSSFRQLTGRAEYIDDIPLSENALHGALILSEIPHGMIISIDTEKAKNLIQVLQLSRQKTYQVRMI